MMELFDSIIWDENLKFHNWINHSKMDLSKISSSKDGKAFIKKQADLLQYKEKVSNKKSLN